MGGVSMRLSEALNGVGRPIAYLPQLAKPVGGVKAAILCCQLFYWSERTNESGWFWKSQEGLADETGLTIDELRAARKALAEKGILKSRYDRMKHRLYFKIDRQRLDDLWVTHNGHIGNSRLPSGKIPDGHLGKVDFGSDPESTSENTSQTAKLQVHHLNGGPDKTESETESVTPEDLVEAWNEHCVPLGLKSISELSNTRRKKSLARLREHPSQSWWEFVFGNIKKSPFLQGRSRSRNSSENPFRASFDWLIDNDTNALKTYEGRYNG